MQGYLFMFFSLFRQREVTKRDHVARFESEQITILKNCAAGLASLKQVLALPSSPFFNHRICYLPLSLSQPILSRRSVTNRTPRPMPMGRERGRGKKVAIARKSRVSESRVMLA